jgi:hypothetical protein
MAAMRRRDADHAIFNAEIMGVAALGAYNFIVLESAPEERQAMMNSKNVVAALRRDVSFVWKAAIAIVFIGFAGLAMASALLDVVSLRY